MVKEARTIPPFLPFLLALFLLALSPVLAAAVAIGREARLELPFSPRWSALVELGIWGVPYLAAAALLAWFFLLSKDERGVFLAFVQRAWPRLARAGR